MAHIKILRKFHVLRTIVDTRECLINVAAAAAKSFQSCPTLCNPIDGSPPGSPVPGILQARTLEWVAIAFSRRPSTAKKKYIKNGNYQSA